MQGQTISGSQPSKRFMVDASRKTLVPQPSALSRSPQPAESLPAVNAVRIGGVVFQRWFGVARRQMISVTSTLAKVVTLDLVDMDTLRLQQEVLRPQNRVDRLVA